MTTGRINQVTIVNGHPKSDRRLSPEVSAVLTPKRTGTRRDPFRRELYTKSFS
jgi:hypothetical protein